MEKENINKIQNIINRMNVEKLVFESLKHEELTESFIDQFIQAMQNAYEVNIAALKDIVKEGEERK